MNQMTSSVWERPGSLFIRYVFQNVFGMIGISAYVLADTLFISIASGADGIATLNLALPVYSFIFALGQMLAVGAGIRFSIYSAVESPEADYYFTNSCLWAIFASFPFQLIGLFGATAVFRIMGGDEVIQQLGTPYLRIVLLCAPFFMLNYICNSFVRNDGAPTRAMFATVTSSLFNIIFDYVFMFPCGMGMTGAALATSLSPLVGIAICASHILSSESKVRLFPMVPSVRRLFASCKLGVSAFVGEFASGVTTIVFNTLILGLAGNLGVAAYGIIANIAIVMNAVLNGISQGGQPLFSHYYGVGDQKKEKRILAYSMLLAFGFGILMIAVANLWPAEIAGIFNSENNDQMLALAVDGMRIYFAGTMFAGLNVVATGYFAATDQAFSCSLVSILRGIIVIILAAIVLAMIFGMKGVWAAFPVTEAFVLLVTVWRLKKTR